jgi:opacity protein-like surface antigen
MERKDGTEEIAMRRRILGVSLAVLSFSIGSAVVRAQGAPGVRFGVFGGAVFPVQDQKDVFKTGWNAGAMLNFNFGDTPLGLRFDGLYSELKTADALTPFFGDAKTRIIAGEGDLVIGPRFAGGFQPYVMGGVGVYDLRFRGQEVDTGNVFSDTTTKFGWNAGTGFAFPLGSASNSRMFVEGKYVSVSTNGNRFADTITTHGSRFTIVPVNLGFIF